MGRSGKRAAKATKGDWFSLGDERGKGKGEDGGDTRESVEAITSLEQENVCLPAKE